MVNNRPPQNESDKKRDNAVFLLPLFGAVFSLPPIMNLFNHKVLLFGMPLTFLYLFSVWTIMVTAAVLISYKRSKTNLPENTQYQAATISNTPITPGLPNDRNSP